MSQDKTLPVSHDPDLFNDTSVLDFVYNLHELLERKDANASNRGALADDYARAVKCKRDLIVLVRHLEEEVNALREQIRILTARENAENDVAGALVRLSQQDDADLPNDDTSLGYVRKRQRDQRAERARVREKKHAQKTAA